MAKRPKTPKRSKTPKKKQKTNKSKTPKKRNQNRIKKICARCEAPLLHNALGGYYDGIICLQHRCCVDCWFETNPTGKRVYEKEETRYTPLVENPFKGRTTKCIGCLKKLPFYEKRKIEPLYDIGVEDDDGVIVLD